MKKPAKSPSPTAFQLAAAAHREGRLEDARAGFLRVLERDGNHVDALHSLGVIHLQKGDFAEAERCLRKALALDESPALLGNLSMLLKSSNRLSEAEATLRRALQLKPSYVEAHNNLGNLLAATGRPTEAEAAYRRALELKADFAEAHNNLGNLLRNAGRLEEAEHSYRRAVTLRPDYADALGNLGLLLQDSGRWTEAEAAYVRALRLNPRVARIHNNLGVLLTDSKRPAPAEAAFRSALQLDPNFADARSNLGKLLHESKRAAEAEVELRRAVELDPGNAKAHINLGGLLRDGKRTAEAEASYRHALRLDPDAAVAHFKLAGLLAEGRRVADAEAAYRRAIELRPDFAEAHTNLGLLLKHEGRLAEAEAEYRCSLRLRPEFADARAQLGLLLLALQRYEEAWPLYESRYAPTIENPVTLPPFAYPKWQGESLAGKSLALWAEQGYGDCIQFVRYAPLLRQRGVARLTLVCPPALAALLETVPGVDAVVSPPGVPAAHDYWSFVLSLPFRFGTTADDIPVHPLPYVQALPERVGRWRDRLPARGIKVGLVWKGNPGHPNDAHRSLPGLASLAPLWSVPGLTFVSLQKGRGEEEAMPSPPGQPLVALGAEIEDFADTAAIVSQLDLVICVDTAIAHVAGAMARPCWVLLPARSPDWRWLLDRPDSPWYPHTRLFRQSRTEDWQETVGHVKTALDAWAGSRR